MQYTPVGGGRRHLDLFWFPIRVSMFTQYFQPRFPKVFHEWLSNFVVESWMYQLLRTMTKITRSQGVIFLAYAVFPKVFHQWLWNLDMETLDRISDVSTFGEHNVYNKVTQGHYVLKKLPCLCNTFTNISLMAFKQLGYGGPRQHLRCINFWWPQPINIGFIM